MESSGTITRGIPPTLSGVSAPELLSFARKYLAYKERFVQINRDRDEARKIIPVSIRACIKHSTLRALCLLGMLGSARDVEEVTDNDVKSWLRTRRKRTSMSLDQRMRSVLKDIKYRNIEEDPSGAALNFVLSALTALDRSNATNILESKVHCKMFINLLTAKIEPDELRKRIKTDMELWTPEQHRNMAYFQRRLSALAVVVSQVETACRNLKRFSRNGLNGIPLKLVIPQKKRLHKLRYSDRQKGTGRSQHAHVPVRNENQNSDESPDWRIVN